MNGLIDGGTERDETASTQTAKPRIRPLDPLRALAEHHRLRCYRDACGDWNIPGRWGEIFWYGSAHDGLPDRIGVQVGGPRPNGSQTAVPIGSNKRVNLLLRAWGKPIQHGDGEAVFVLPADRILEAAQSIGAKRRRVLSPERRAAVVERLKRIRRTSRTAAPIDNFPLGPPVACGSGAENRRSVTGG